MPDEPTIAYLFSRYPVVSQTFCDTEMLALERQGACLQIYAIHPPSTSFRHAYHRALKAPVRYAPPTPALKALVALAAAEKRWPDDLLAGHAARFGADSKPGTRMRNALHLADSMRRNGVRHVHVHFANRAAHTALYIKHLAGIPFSFTAHAQDFLVEVPPTLLAELVAEAAFVVAVSDHTRALLAAQFPDHAAKIHRVHNGIDLANFPASPAPRNPVPVLLGVGRLVPFKGFLHLIRACGALRDRGLNFRCQIVGEGPQRPELEAEIGTLGLGEMVQLVGTTPLEDVAARLGKSDVFVLPCDIEPDGSMDVLPTVITEAMAAGRVVVSTPTAGVPELVADGETGVLTPRANPEALAAALFRLLADHELRGDMGRAGRARVERLFRVEETSAQLLALFRRHLADAPPPSPTPATRADPRLLLLLSSWPDEDFPMLEKTLRALVDAGVEAGPVALACPGDPEDPALAPHLAFLPDAMAIEGLWRESAAAAHQLEGLRNQLPESLDTATFLMAARRALAVRVRFPEAHHAHAVGCHALLCAWILHRAHGIGFSVDLSASPVLPTRLLKTLIDGAEGGGCADPKLAAELGLGSPSTLAPPRPGPLGRFLGQPGPVTDTWIARLREWT